MKPINPNKGSILDIFPISNINAPIIAGIESMNENIANFFLSIQANITDDMVKKLENWIDKYTKELPELNRFILSGGVEVSTLLHVARTICRKSERRIVSLKRSEEIDKNVLKYMNRLSDYLFTAARLATHRAGKEDHKWNPRGK